jgi:hypothetical protein
MPRVEKLLKTKTNHILFYYKTEIYFLIGDKEQIFHNGI